MNRTGLYIALALAVVVGGIFGVYPELDLRIAGYFFRSDVRPDIPFGLRMTPLLPILRDSGLWISAIVVAPAVVAVVLKVIRPRAPMIMPGRAAILLITTLAIGPGVITNVILKDYWGRPRPIDVTQFGGAEHFVAWWDPRGDCEKNCSFVSGDVSGAYWTLAAAAVAPAPWQPIAYAAALAFGSAMGLMRMMAGAHFISDVFFAGFFTFVVIWLVYRLLYCWPRTRTTDRAVEDAIARAVTFGANATERRRVSPRVGRTKRKR